MHAAGPASAARRVRAERAARAGLEALLAALRRHYDHRAWWPARSRTEMMIGAILTQRTRWEAAAEAIARLRRRGLLQHERLGTAGARTIARVIRPCGSHRVKGARLAALGRFLRDRGGPAGLARLRTPALRSEFLSVPGIGPETADCILVYAYGRPVFVADAYALRLLSRTGWLRRHRVAATYGAVHDRVTALYAGRAGALAALHALVVEHGKRLCGARPRCGDCFLARDCATGRRLTARRAPRR